jgi:hypothetical protein
VPLVELPAPTNCTPETEMPPDQLQVPPGTLTVSPALAAASADATSVREHDNAFSVAAAA